MLKKKLTNQIVLVTGASSGLGEQICYEAASKGAIVVACARRMHLLTKVRERCVQISGKPAFAFELDVSNQLSIDHVLADVQKKVGSIDVLVNNAGFGLFEQFMAIDFVVAKKMFEVNVLGMMYLSQTIAIQMAEQKQGHIINIASMAGKMATAKSTIYSATKFAVIGFSNALRLELKPLGIFVTTVNPGPIHTNFFEQADPTGNYLKTVDCFALDANRLAKEIVSSMKTARREINRPFIMESAARLYQFFPKIGDIIAGGLLNKK